MINYKQVKGRSYFGMSADELATFAELIWHWKHDPKPIGFNRKPMTKKQEKLIETFFDLINFPEDYAEMLNKRHGQ